MKLLRFVVTGRELPAHIGKAYGRNIFRLMHVARPVMEKRDTMWLRDLPLSLNGLAYDYGFKVPALAYHAECDRVGVPLNERCCGRPA